MKLKHTLTIIAGMTFAFSACQKSDQGQPSRKSQLLGKWKEVKLYTKQTTNGVTTEETLTSTPSATELYLNAYDGAEFTEDNKANISAAPSIDPKNGSNIPYWLSISDYTYTLSGSELILTAQNNPAGPLVLNMTITKLDAGQLILHYTHKNGNDEVIRDTYYTRN